MGLRFRKRVKVAPGVYLNVGKSGVSASIGPKGATVNVGGKRKPRATASIPGSGLSVSSEIEQRPSGFGFIALMALLAILYAVFG